MKRGIKYPGTQIEVPITREGESIEQMLRRMRSNKEPIQATAKINYSERKAGVLPMFDIRSDRFEMALKAADRVQASAYAQRMIEDGFEEKDGKWVAKATDTEIPEA